MNENQIMEFMNNIEYGWVDKNNNKHSIVDEFYSDNYILQGPEETMNSKTGVCWDQVELERYYFENIGVNVNTYFLCHYDDNMCPTHTFLVYKKDSDFYWFEHSWNKYKGIHKYNSLKRLLADVKNKFIKTELNNNYNKNNLMFYEYSKPKYGMSVIDFYKHCEKSNSLHIDNL
ncbi:MAG: hypothetical protein PHN72_02205 [Bacilli bacterium]|nr:hypothetical protein [Bacilli bacterium]